MKEKEPSSFGIVVGLFFSFVFVVAFIGSVLPEGNTGSPVLYLFLSALSIWYLKSCVDNRKKFFINRRISRMEAEQKANAEQEILSKAKEGAKSKLLPCTFLGGSGFNLHESDPLVFALLATGVKFARISDGKEITVEFDEIRELEVSGPGTVTTNAGISGGGFGLEGFLKGAVTAAVINTATTKSSTNTFARILTTAGEVYFHTSAIEPAALKIMLSPVYVSIANRSRGDGNTQATVVQEIEKLHKLKQDGLLDEAEFKAAKNKLLGL